MIDLSGAMKGKKLKSHLKSTSLRKSRSERLEGTKFKISLKNVQFLFLVWLGFGFEATAGGS